MAIEQAKSPDKDVKDADSPKFEQKPGKAEGAEPVVVAKEAEARLNDAQKLLTHFEPYKERMGAVEVNTGISAGENTYFNFSHQLFSGEAPTFAVGHVLTLNNGNTFSIEYDPRAPLSDQFVALTIPLVDRVTKDEMGKLRLGASFAPNLTSDGARPYAYDIAFRRDIPSIRGELGVAVAATPPTPDYEGDWSARFMYTTNLNRLLGNP